MCEFVVLTVKYDVEVSLGYLLQNSRHVYPEAHNMSLMIDWVLKVRVRWWYTNM